MWKKERGRPVVSARTGRPAGLDYLDVRGGLTLVRIGPDRAIPPMRCAGVIAMVDVSTRRPVLGRGAANRSAGVTGIGRGIVGHALDLRGIVYRLAIADIAAAQAAEFSAAGRRAGGVPVPQGAAARSAAIVFAVERLPRRARRDFSARDNRAISGSNLI